VSLAGSPPFRSASVEAIARHYDELDVFYRDVWGEHVHHGLWLTGDESPDVAVRQLVDHVAEVAQLSPGMTVCDVGCGYGATARQLAKAYGAEVTGLTISGAQHGYAHAHPVKGTSFLLRNWMDNGLPDAVFDATIAIESLSHMPDRARFFHEAARVLRPGGRLVVCAWCSSAEAAPWARRSLLDPICKEGRLTGLATPSEIGQWLDEAGLMLLTHDDLSRQVMRTWWIVLRRVVRNVLTDARYRQYLTDWHQRNRVFVLTIPRLLVAYGVGALRYGLFVAQRA
jgi:tocopherol O-methyltransferase